MLQATTEHDLNLFIGKRLRKRRRLLGLTQEQVASHIGIRFQQIQKYESGANRVSASRLHRLAEVLRVPITYFYPDPVLGEAVESSADSVRTARRADEAARIFSRLEEPIQDVALKLLSSLVTKKK